MPNKAVIGAVIVAAAIQVLIVLLLRVWGKRVAARQGGVLWHRASWIPIAGLGVLVTGTAWTLVSLVLLFTHVRTAVPAQKGMLLDVGITDAMLPAFVSLKLSWLLFAVSFVVSLVGALKPPREFRRGQV